MTKHTVSVTNYTEVMQTQKTISLSSIASFETATLFVRPMIAIDPAISILIRISSGVGIVA